MSYPRYLWLWVKGQWLRFRMAFLRFTLRGNRSGVFFADPEWVAESRRQLREEAAAGDPAAIELLRMTGDLPPEE